MSQRRSLARWFLIGGGMLAVLGGALWFALPLRLDYPPYGPTALLMLGYGGACLWRGRPPGGEK